MTAFDAPAPEALLHRYNLAQAQGVLYRAEQVVLTAHRNDPGEYKLLFRYLKLFGLMSLHRGRPRPRLHHHHRRPREPVRLEHPLRLITRQDAPRAPPRDALEHGRRTQAQGPLRRDEHALALCTLESGCGLVSHYPPGKTYDSMVEKSFAERWQKTDTEWKLEREVDLVTIPGSVMVPDFRLVHPDGQVVFVRDCRLLASRISERRSSPKSASRFVTTSSWRCPKSSTWKTRASRLRTCPPRSCGSRSG